MKRFIIRSVISFLLIFIFVSGISYVFYHHIAEGYVENEIKDVVRTNSRSTRDLVNIKFKETKENLENYYNINKSKSLYDMTKDAKTKPQFEGYDIEFGDMYNNKLVTEMLQKDNTIKPTPHPFQSNRLDNDFIKNDIYCLNYGEIFQTTSNTVKVFFTLDEFKDASGNVNYRKVAILDSDMYFNSLLSESRSYSPDSFLVTEDGHIYYKTYKDVNFNNFLQKDAYLSSTSVNYEVSDLTDSIVKGEEGVVSNLKFLGEKCYLTYYPLEIDRIIKNQTGTENRKVKVYLASIFPDESLVNLRDDLVLPLSIMFTVLSVVLLVGVTLLYLAALKKSSDIEASKLSLYYSKPYVLQINKKGKIIYKNNSFKKLNFDWNKYQNVYYFDLVGDEIDILGAINKRKSITIQMTDETGFVYTFFMVPVKVNLGMYLLGQEVTKKYKEISSLIKEITYDTLTNLPNKKILYDDLTEHLTYIRNEKNNNKHLINSSLIIFSIQRLERLSNIFGTATADKLIINFIEIIKSKIGHDENLYRFDKDLFGILFKDLENYDKVIEWINDLMSELKRPISIDENQLMILIKCGIFNIELDIYDDLNEEKIYECAEIAFNHANGLSSIDYMVYNISLGRLIKKEQLMEEDLKNAIENDEFIVYVQPQYDTNLNRIVGFEALTRWNNPKYLTDSPQHFIEMAEKNNMIVPIGRIITDQAFAIAKQLEKYNIVMSINVSPAQMMQDGFVSQFIATCEKYETNPEMIALEITETFLVQNFKVVNEKLGVLKKYGFKIHLDDFGTGYSSLLYLKDLPIDAIKIDKEFTKYINTDKRTRAIVSKLISLATSLELYIIAEGVEDEKQSIFLNKNGCSIIQGWLIGKAMPVEKAIKLLKEYNIDKTKVLDIEVKPKKKTTKSKTGATKKTTTKKTPKKKENKEVVEEKKEETEGGDKQ